MTPEFQVRHIENPNHHLESCTNNLTLGLTPSIEDSQGIAWVLKVHLSPNIAASSTELVQSPKGLLLGECPRSTTPPLHHLGQGPHQDLPPWDPHYKASLLCKGTLATPIWTPSIWPCCCVHQRHQSSAFVSSDTFTGIIRVSPTNFPRKGIMMSCLAGSRVGCRANQTGWSFGATPGHRRMGPSKSGTLRREL
jgi:hypothetical protein